MDFVHDGIVATDEKGKITVLTEKQKDLSPSA